MTDAPQWVLRQWAEKQTVKRLRDIADGMPYLHESKKAEIVNWLMSYHPEFVARAIPPGEQS